MDNACLTFDDGHLMVVDAEVVVLRNTRQIVRTDPERLLTGSQDMETTRMRYLVPACTLTTASSFVRFDPNSSM